jgi:hypothetical protein
MSPPKVGEKKLWDVWIRIEGALDNPLNAYPKKAAERLLALMAEYDTLTCYKLAEIAAYACAIRTGNAEDARTVLEGIQRHCTNMLEDEIARTDADLVRR